MFKYSIVFCLIFTCENLFSQGHIDHIKNQEYLKHKNKIDCNNQLGDNLSERICVNLAYQKEDSILTVVYDSLLLKAEDSSMDSLKYNIIELQTTWRTFRDQHCAIIYKSYEGCAGCHLQAIAYMNCLIELTADRVKELRNLYQQLFE